MGMGSTASYITIYTDETESEEIANYYVILYGDFDGDGEIGMADSIAVRSNGDEYMWDGEMDHFVMACAGDVNGDYEVSATDTIIIKLLSSGKYTINQDHDNHWGEGEAGPYEEV